MQRAIITVNGYENFIQKVMQITYHKEIFTLNHLFDVCKQVISYFVGVQFESVEIVSVEKQKFIEYFLMV